MSPGPQGKGDDGLRRRLDAVVGDLGLADPEPVEPLPAHLRRRRGVDAGAYSQLATLSLVREDGVLRWVYEPPPRRATARRGGRRAEWAIGTEPVYSFKFEELPPNRIIEKLESLDRQLTPAQGLRRWQRGGLAPVDRPAIDGRALLLVHGTFSKSDMFFEELAASAPGRQLLDRAGDTTHRYKAVLAFDHPTLSVSPWINALDLQSQLRRVRGPIDVVCHSRGGLVGAWWLRTAPRPVERIVFVGSPLAGTNLASPARLRATLHLLANVVGALETVGAATATIAPLAGVVTGLAKILGGVLRLGASLPLADAGIAMVPGLAAQSRVGNNAELLRLFAEPWPGAPACHAVIANFEPDETKEPIWKFWRRFRNLGGQVADAAADLVFEGQNDLVVDTDSMALVGGKPLPKGQIKDFGTTGAVHHCSYFRHPETAVYLRKILAL